MAEAKCPRCGQIQRLHPRWDVCWTCAAYCGWDPRCEACIAIDRGIGDQNLTHVSTCGFSIRQRFGHIFSLNTELVQAAQQLHQALVEAIPRINYQLTLEFIKLLNDARLEAERRDRTGGEVPGAEA